LKPVQVKELKDSFENLEKEGKGHKSLKPERFTRAAAREAAATDESPDDVAEEPEGKRLILLSRIGVLYLS
jgi:cytoskeleton-associated protein 5